MTTADASSDRPPLHQTPAPTVQHPHPRHVWVGHDPGVLLDWRREPDGWHALVVWAPSGPDRYLQQRWLPAAVVRPAS